MESFFLGFMGSLHCLGMCSGFVLAFQKRTWWYQGGRALGYTLLGAVCGLLGESLRHVVGSPTLQMMVGVAFIAFGLGWSLPRGPLGRLLVFFGPLLRKPGVRTASLMGFLTAFLPCGLLGAAWVKAAGTGTWLGGMGAMFSFWLGTLPALVLLASVPKLVTAYRVDSVWFGRLVSASVIGLGVITLLRAFLVPAASCCH